MVRNLQLGPKLQLVVGTVHERIGPLSYIVETEDEQAWKGHTII